MLTRLFIKNVVLIDSLTIDFNGGLCTLTGETGAGKSILLDSLGLTLGARADSSLVRKGTDRSTVTASFDLKRSHPVWAVLEEHGLDTENNDLILRRTLTATGKSRAFVNDQAISVALLKEIATDLIEVHGQFDTSALLDPIEHRNLLDSFGGLAPIRTDVEKHWDAWHNAKIAYQTALNDVEKDKSDEDYLRHLVEELRTLAPELGEEAILQEQRNIVMHQDKVVEVVQKSQDLLLNDETGVETCITKVQYQLDQISEIGAERFAPAVEACNRAVAEISEIIGELSHLSTTMDHDININEVEERLFALKDCARKHHCNVDDLPVTLDDLTSRLDAIDNSAQDLEGLKQKSEQARTAYIAYANKLSAARAEIALKLNNLVNKELPPLKLEKAIFTTSCTELDEAHWNALGQDKVEFTIQTNPGTPAGALGKVASGGELSRIMLALKAVLANTGHIPTLIFDEVDSGIGGATADAVGERLKRLADQYQVLAITHSPQVAALASNHLMVSKSDQKDATITTVVPLSKNDRLEEIARMLSGAKITDEARAAAIKLMGIHHDAAA